MTDRLTIECPAGWTMTEKLLEDGTVDFWELESESENFEVEIFPSDPDHGEVSRRIHQKKSEPRNEFVLAVPETCVREGKPTIYRYAYIETKTGGIIGVEYVCIDTEWAATVRAHEYNIEAKITQEWMDKVESILTTVKAEPKR